MYERNLDVGNRDTAVEDSEVVLKKCRAEEWATEKHVLKLDEVLFEIDGDGMLSVEGSCIGVDGGKELAKWLDYWYGGNV